MEIKGSMEKLTPADQVQPPNTPPIQRASSHLKPDMLEGAPKAKEEKKTSVWSFLSNIWTFCLAKIFDAYELVLWAFGFREEEEETPQAKKETPKIVEDISPLVTDKEIETPPKEEATPPVEIKKTLEPLKIEEAPESPKVEKTPEPPKIEEAPESPKVEKTAEPPKIEKAPESPKAKEVLPMGVVEQINANYAEAAAQFNEHFDEKMASLFQVILSDPKKIDTMQQNKDNYREFRSMLRLSLQNQDSTILTNRTIALTSTIDKLTSDETTIEQFQLFFKPLIPFFKNNPSNLGQVLENSSQKIKEKLDESSLTNDDDLKDLKQLFGSFISSVGKQLHENPKAYNESFIPKLSEKNNFKKVIDWVTERFPDETKANPKSVECILEDDGYLFNKMAHPTLSKKFGLKDTININIVFFQELIKNSNDKQLKEIISLMIGDEDFNSCLIPTFKEIGIDPCGLTRTKDSLIAALQLLRSLHQEIASLE